MKVKEPEETEPHCGTCRWFLPEDSSFQKGSCTWREEHPLPMSVYDLQSYMLGSEGVGCQCWEGHGKTRIKKHMIGHFAASPASAPSPPIQGL